MDEFFDAKSLLGSLGQAFSLAIASSHAPAGGGSPGSLPGGADLDAFAMHDLAASIREVTGVREGREKQERRARWPDGWVGVGSAPGGSAAH